MQSQAPDMRTHRQVGAATTELVVAVPLLLLMLLATVQGGVWMHATHIAQAGAAQALAAARTDDGTVAAGQAQARSVLGQLGDGVLVDARVSVARGADRVRVEIHGTAASVLPGIRLPVTVAAEGPLEKWSTPR